MLWKTFIRFCSWQSVSASSAMDCTQKTKTWRKPSWHLAAVWSLPERQISVNHNFPQSKGIGHNVAQSQEIGCKCSPLSYYILERRTLTLRTYFFRALCLAFPNEIIPYFFRRAKKRADKSQLFLFTITNYSNIMELPFGWECACNTSTGGDAMLSIMAYWCFV